MELGQRLRQARLEAGLSQRQLCGDTITRNMLSQIENGTARPSMDTLAHLARRLGKPISFFLEEQAVTSPNQQVMAAARTAFAAGEYDRAVSELADYRPPDPVFDQERSLLLALSALRLAEEAVRAGKTPYARELLDQAAHAAAGTMYWGEELERRRLTLLCTLAPETAAQLPSDDAALLSRARWALQRQEFLRAGQYLDAAEDRSDPQWRFLRGECCFALKDYAEAAHHYHAAEAQLPGSVIPRLEQCYKELGDYKRAYEYACKGR